MTYEKWLEFYNIQEEFEDCDLCGGDGANMCEICDGDGCSECDEGWIACGWCKGEGRTSLSEKEYKNILAHEKKLLNKI